MPISNQRIRFFLRMSISVTILGALFKVLHWAGAPILFVGGCIGIVVFYSTQFYRKKPKRLLDYSKFFLLLSFLFHYTFRVLHLKYGHVFTILTQLALLVFLILYVHDVLFSEHDHSENNASQLLRRPGRKAISYLLNGLATMGIIIGALLKILHWEFNFVNGNLLLCIGLLAAATSVIMGSTDTKT